MHQTIPNQLECCYGNKQLAGPVLSSVNKVWLVGMACSTGASRDNDGYAPDESDTTATLPN